MQALLIPPVYVVFMLNTLVSFLLLLGTDRLTGYPSNYRGCVPAALIGGVNAWICACLPLSHSCSCVFKVASMVLTGLVAFGWGDSSLRRCAVYFILSLAMEGAVLGLGKRNHILIVLCSIGICSVCFLSEGSASSLRRILPVIIRSEGKTLFLNALADTGNSLKDPISGEPVMVVGYSAANTITGLSKKQLEAPLDTMQSAPQRGFRLIPYTSVGTDKGMLLAIVLPDVEINGRKQKQLVALAPGELGEFDALLGGFWNA